MARWRGRRCKQCAYGSLRREVALPTSAIPEKTQARYRAGVLRIVLAKADGAHVRRIAGMAT